MRAHVYTDRALAKHAGRFVWLSIDTEKDSSAGFLEAVPMEAWPTIFVLQPADGSIALKWLGSATVEQLEKILEDGERACAPKAAPALAGADALLSQAKQSFAAGDPAEAERLCREAIAGAPPGWPRRAEAAEALILALLATGDLKECAQAAQAEAPALPRGPSFANIAGTGLSCAQALDDPEWRAELSAALEPLVVEATGLASVLADDRSSLFDTLVKAREAASDPDGAKKTAVRWLEFLEAEAAKAKTAEARAAFDAHRVTAALEADLAGRAIPALEQTEKELPADYNAPARLALLYQALGRLDEALAANGRALAKVYGPRRLRLLEMRADVHEARGEPDAARKALADALEFAAALPKVKRPEAQVARIEARLGRLAAP